MNDATHVSKIRCLLVWAGITATVGALLGRLLPIEMSLQGAFDVLLVRVCSWALLGCGAWFWLVSTLVVATALRPSAEGAPGLVRGVPAPVRRMILLLCGIAIAGGIVAPALATPGPVPLDKSDHRGRVTISGLPYPDRATATPAPHAAATRTDPEPSRRHTAVEAARQRSRQVVVRAGDSLWSIAARHLQPGATNPEIAAGWHALYALNRALLGPDPDRIEPGQVLDLPVTLSAAEGASS